MSYIVAVAKRCTFGYPQVLVCSPLPLEKILFPTVFWLTCPFLIKKCGRLESAKQISNLEEIFRSKPKEVEEWHKAYSSLREKLITIKPINSTSSTKKIPDKAMEYLLSKGVGGIDVKHAPFAVKCLHLQVATWLGMRKHPAAQWLNDKIGVLECAEAFCDPNKL
ncbi:MAG: DUF501 domain-containing protein [Synergistaceae bacterium]|nr:DUF501 domain-containing protein [Synergistaceae bacterium]